MDAIAISAAEWEVLSFFEVEPYRDVMLVLKRGAEKLYELNALGVDDVKYEKSHGTEVLEIVLSPRELIRLKVKPQIEIDHRRAAA